MIIQMLEELNVMLFTPLGQWSSRTKDANLVLPTQQEIIDHQVHELIQVFIRFDAC